MPSPVTEIAPVAPAEMAAHAARRLALETDCADVHAALSAGADFVLLDVRGRAAFAAGHVPGAVSLPHRDITEARLAAWPAETVFVVYCAGPHCNGADRAALRLAMLGRRVKTMPGGITGWCDEGLPLATGRAGPPSPDTNE
ncbi:rhodanese-like domain-containing protein [Falsiroseomonas oryziterrae]|uniref:rhodanese-like domain-containing protein n=1 Tax=Falsiroseomonas oryziterrae TaxID=2911368 RepID=UPI001F22A926|nr:rhodanese-like domain-containing protein [Roseomonas sp. NPKOSM-4]